MNIEVTSFSLGVIVAIVAILLVALVVMVLKLKKDINNLSWVPQSFDNLSQEIANVGTLAKDHTNSCVHDILNCDLPMWEKKCNSYTDSRIDKLVK
jgi:hypothetical protein